MAKNGKSKKSKKNKDPEENLLQLKTETKHGILAVIFFVITLFFTMSAFGKAGVAGEFLYEKFSFLLGLGYVLLPTLFFLLGISFWKSEAPNVGLSRTTSSVMFLFSGLGLLDIVSGSNINELGEEIDQNAGGFLGDIVSMPLVGLFDVYASFVFLLAVLMIAVLIMFDTKLGIPEFLKKLWFKITGKEVSDEEDSEEEVNDDEVEEEIEEEEEKINTKEKIKQALGVAKPEAPIEEPKEEEMPIKKRRNAFTSEYTPPPLSLLEEDKGKPNTGDIKANANIIKRTLANFGIEVEMDEITVGPTITRYALKPAEGIKLSRIVGLQNDLALALAAHPIRIEAPIPGKSLVGIEIPNKSKSIVGLATLLRDDKFAQSPKPLTIALGRAIAGRGVFGNLAKMPHCLVAGTTGSGKSVTIHAMIASLLYKNGPNDLKFIMIDPKRVELTLYNNIPHLLTPVITQPKKAILALKWAAKEMERRYDLLEKESVRDIESYHENVLGQKKKTKTNEKGEEEEVEMDRLPYIIIFIDELADIMTSYPRELEGAIVRLAQMSRAVGIHLVLSTQRPEVNVITGLIKANIPARIALKVSSQIDSRTILDAGGAEKLLGAGDMLYSSGETAPERLQSAFISETEVKNVVKYLADKYKDELSEEISLSGESMGVDKSIFESTIDEDSDEEDDELYEEARQAVIEAGKASTSYLQRKLKLGYGRAARLIDKLQERGVIGPQDGSKPREILERIERTESGENVV